MKKLWAPWRLSYVERQRNGTSECIFCIGDDAEEDRSRLVLHRGKHAFVIMNRYPYSNGHLMVCPFRHGSDLESLGDSEIVEIHRLTELSCQALRQAYAPDGFNIGLNLGVGSGAGVDDHLHYHVVPRWTGDTNFMPVLAEVRVVSEHLDSTYQRLAQEFGRICP